MFSRLRRPVRPSSSQSRCERATYFPAPAPARDTTVDLLVIGSGTGMAAALAARER